MRSIEVYGFVFWIISYLLIGKKVIKSVLLTDCSSAWINIGKCEPESGPSEVLCGCDSHNVSTHTPLRILRFPSLQHGQHYSSKLTTSIPR